MLSTNTYKIVRTCLSCRGEDSIEVSKREAAFELVDINKKLGDSCRNCFSTLFTTAFHKPDIDIELLQEWALNQNLYFLSQDEDLLLAEGKYLDIILEVLDTMRILDYKMAILMSALCVLVYDNTFVDTEVAERLKMRVVEELNKRPDKLRMADRIMHDYIKKWVYPQLSIEC